MYIIDLCSENRSNVLFKLKLFDLFLFTRGMKTARLCVELNAQPVGLQRINKNIVVGCMDQTVQCYTTKVGWTKTTCLIWKGWG